jgi:hypothetical protein
MIESATTRSDTAAAREQPLERLPGSVKAGDVVLVEPVVALPEAVWRRDMCHVTSERHAGLSSPHVVGRRAARVPRGIPDVLVCLDPVVSKTKEAAHQAVGALEAVMPTFDDPFAELGS